MKPYYQDDACTIYHGDCREVLSTDPPYGIEAVLTDPPYGEVNRPSNGITRFDFGDADTETMDIQELCILVSGIEASTIYVWCGTEQVSHLRASMIAAGMSTRVLVWEKTNPRPVNGQHMWLSSIELCVFGRRKGAKFNEHCVSPVFRYPIESDRFGHPTTKNFDLFYRIIQASSEPGDLILDPFMGSGTTLRAAKDLGRKSIGIEISEKYCEIAAQRLEQGALPLEGL